MIKKDSSTENIRIGRRIKTLRVKRSITQKELADRVMISPSSITRLESGETMVSVQILQRIAKSLKVPVGVFWDEQREDIEFDDPEVMELLKKCTPSQREKLNQIFKLILDCFLENDIVNIG
ncbi:helix-turn-helix domain-containing protein [Alitiscatomonas aceti]|uniref:Helix-turn-helix domain-containing protein n=1 Tax=Alitiscatomonas aceti TaxID=2981724 RepID=A0ABT2V4P5_9FIRM|nr:helix-turn-helix transcriptional regulator [Alitiscatomonas aceti]MCU6801491.1 helix-turn-helix domain-containing protein [Alitiscatomonas aceti]